MDMRAIKKTLSTRTTPKIIIALIYFPKWTHPQRYLTMKTFFVSMDVCNKESTRYKI